jgi:hypothetical protein
LRLQVHLCHVRLLLQLLLPPLQLPVLLLASGVPCRHIAAYPDVEVLQQAAVQQSVV